MVQNLTVDREDNDLRLDRWFRLHFPALTFVHLQKLLRTGQVRIDGRRAKTNSRVMTGNIVRVPPLGDVQAETPRSQTVPEDAAFLNSIILYQDEDVMVLNKPYGLAVQGGSGTHRHIDRMLESLASRKGEVPRLVHRLDKDTSGCLVVARRRSVAAELAKTFRSRSARKIYWALVKGVPRVAQGRISTYLAKGKNAVGDDKMQVARHGDKNADHALTYYAVVETAAQQLAWLSLKPVTGRTHQLRAHTAHMGHPIIGDPKYFEIENWQVPGGIQNRLHLLARRIILPHPSGSGQIDVTAPLPPHMQQSWNLLGFDHSAYDPIIDAPER